MLTDVSATTLVILPGMRATATFEVHAFQERVVAYLSDPRNLLIANNHGPVVASSDAPVRTGSWAVMKFHQLQVRVDYIAFRPPELVGASMAYTGRGSGVDFTWSDMTSSAVCDPSVRGGGPAALVMRRSLLPRLADKGLTIFWTTLVESNLRRNDYTVPGDEYRWVGASASYILAGDHIELVRAQAGRFRPGPRVERRLSWTPKPTERA